MEGKFVQPWNAPSPMDVTLDGIVIVVLKPVHTSNAFIPMEVTLDGIVMVDKAVQLQNASSPMEESFASCAKVTVCKDEQ